MKITLFPLLIFFFLQSAAQQSSLIILGDLHHDRLEDHDMDWLSKKPDDLRQVTKEYTINTRDNWSDFMDIIKHKADSKDLSVKAILQLGDLSEGLAGSNEKAGQMAMNTMKAIDSIRMPVPWIIAKGNHDITGPGAIEAFQNYYVPMFRKQTNNPKINSATYTYRANNIQITCLDPWDKSQDMADVLERELSGSNAKYKFVMIHEPVIPVTERCWHVLRNELEKREKLLNVIARNRAIVLCGHLHRYSVVRRNTPSGPIVQVMVTSVVKDRNYLKPQNVITKYGPELAENVPDWQPETLNSRKAMLSEEAKYVTDFKQTDLPGYAVITVDEKKDRVILKYYAAFGKEPFDSVDLTKLLHR